MNKPHIPPQTARPLGNLYSHGIEVPAGARWLHIAGQVGMEADETVPEGIETQAHAAWRNLVAVLESADMSVADLVHVNHWLVNADDFPKYSEVRAGYLGKAKPASTLMIVKALVRPELLIEISAVAAKLDHD